MDKKKGLDKWVFYFLLWGFVSTEWLYAESKIIHLAIGEQISFKISAGSRFSVGNSEIIRAKTSFNEKNEPILLVKAKSQGYSDLIVFEANAKGSQQKNYSFRVVTKKEAASFQELPQALDPEKNLKWKKVGGVLVPTGLIFSLEQWNALQSEREKNKNLQLNHISLHPLERLRAESEIKQAFKELKLDDLETLAFRDLLYIKGRVSSKEELEMVQEVVKKIFSTVKFEIKIGHSKKKNARYEAKIFEVLKGESERLGIQWDSLSGPNILISKNLSKIDLGLSGLIDFMEKRGTAKLISKPSLLLTESGKAELRVGGEIPITIKSKDKQSTDWKYYGIQMKITSSDYSSKGVRANIEIQTSSLDSENSLEGIPAIRTSSMKSEIDLSFGSSVILTGLIEQSNREMISGIPFFSKIPILGSLFQSSEFRNNRSELLMSIRALEAD
ncbi:MAG: type II and III secretion system protein [Oligoflexia bacterium]|nr:type II and III secretion system protein [Oligoflexia bacterium]